MTPRLKDRYRKEIIQSLMTKLNYKNINAVPKIKKIVLNMGLGQDGLDKKKMEVQVTMLELLHFNHELMGVISLNKFVLIVQVIWRQLEET